MTGTLTYENCSITANSGSGCTVNDTNTNSYGAEFASAGGGVYIGEFSSDYVRVWFFTVSTIFAPRADVNEVIRDRACLVGSQ